MRVPDKRDLEPMTAMYRTMLRAGSNDAVSVGWKSEETQLRQFAAASEVFRDHPGPFEVYDVGCGLGAYATFLRDRYERASYRGCDLMPEMVEGARARVPDTLFEVRDVLTEPPAPADYCVAMGSFNGGGGLEESRWTELVRSVLTAMFGFARVGICATFLTDRVDWRREFGAYFDPYALATFAERELSRFVEVRCGYYPWEFTLHVLHGPRPLRYGPPPVPWPPESRARPDSSKW